MAKVNTDNSLALEAASGFRQELIGRQFGGSPELVGIAAQFQKALSSIDPTATEMRQVAALEPAGKGQSR